MVLLDVNSKPMQIKSFECELFSLDSQDKQIKFKYEPVVNIRNIRHCCKLKKMTTEKDSKNKTEEEKICFGNDFIAKVHNESSSISTFNSSTYTMLSQMHNDFVGKVSPSKDSFILKENSKVTVKFEFKNFTEYVEKGDVVIINEPFMRSYGVITKCEQT